MSGLDWDGVADTRAGVFFQQDGRKRFLITKQISFHCI